MKKQPGEPNETMLRVGILVGIPAVLSSLGRAAEPVLRESGFQLAEFSDPDHLVPFVKASRLLDNCVAATGCDHLGLLIGERVCPSHLGIAGFLMRSAGSVEVALGSLVENFDLNDGGGVVCLNIGAEQTTLSYVLRLDDVAAKEQVFDLAAAAMFQVVRAVCGDDWRPQQVNIARRRPRETAVYEQYFRVMPVFDATELSMSFDNRWLEEVPATTDPLLFAYLRKEAVKAHSLRGRTLTDALPLMLRRGLLAERYSADCIARDLGIHERTLHRRLRAVGTNFRSQLDAARELLGKELLENTRLPVGEIAGALGYADSSSFIRAFQRWTGSTPLRWRGQ